MTWFDGAAVAVTGAAGGIGQATCTALAERGARVFGLDIRPAPAGTHVPCDVTDPASVAEAIGEVAGAAGGIDGLVAAAGVVEANMPAEEMSADEFDRVLAVNLRGVFLCCTEAGRRMLAAGAGRIVTVSSMSGSHVVNYPQRQCAYNASKAAVTALTRSLAVEWGPRGVRLNAVAPGYVDTPLLGEKTGMFAGWKDGTVAGRFADPAEIAGAICWLLSDEAGFCVGTELLIDGGYSLR